MYIASMIILIALTLSVVTLWVFVEILEGKDKYFSEE